MKIHKFFLLVFMVLTGISAYGQATVTGTAYTEIVPLSIVKETTQFNAGRFSVIEEGGSITITPTGARLTNGSVMLLNGAFSQGGFSITGSESNTFGVVLPDGPQLLYHNNSINSIYLDKWTYEIQGSRNGEAIINIGATLNFKSVQANPPGFYTGKYRVIFFYN